jgi:hypothetical protein
MIIQGTLLISNPVLAPPNQNIFVNSHTHMHPQLQHPKTDNQFFKASKKITCSRIANSLHTMVVTNLGTYETYF